MAPPQAYNIAIVGFPKSGKTTLIVSLFDEIFLGRINLKMVPAGRRPLNELIRLWNHLSEEERSALPLHRTVLVFVQKCRGHDSRSQSRIW